MHGEHRSAVVERGVPRANDVTEISSCGWLGRTITPTIEARGLPADVRGELRIAPGHDSNRGHTRRIDGPDVNVTARHRLLSHPASPCADDRCMTDDFSMTHDELEELAEAIITARQPMPVHLKPAIVEFLASGDDAYAALLAAIGIGASRELEQRVSTENVADAAYVAAAVIMIHLEGLEDHFAA